MIITPPMLPINVMRGARSDPRPDGRRGLTADRGGPSPNWPPADPGEIDPSILRGRPPLRRPATSLRLGHVESLAGQLAPGPTATLWGVGSGIDSLDLRMSPSRSDRR